MNTAQLQHLDFNLFKADPVTGLINVNYSRPWQGADGKTYIAANDANGNLYAQEIRANATLRKDDWISLDTALRNIATIRLNGIADLQNAGLIYNAGDLGSTVAEWQTGSDMTPASVTMSGEAKNEKDRQEFGLAGVPLPIIRKDFTINQRTLLSSRRSGAGLDTTQMQVCTRLVAEKSEYILFRGDSNSLGNYSIYGYCTHPSRNTGTLGVDWGATTPSGQGIVNDVLRMIAASEAARHYGPFILYVPGDYMNNLRNDFKTNSDKTILQRLLEIDVISQVKVSDQLAADNVVLVQMTADVVDLAVAQDMTTVNWASGDGFSNSFAVFAAWVPRIKPDYDSRLGITHFTLTTP